VIPVDPRQIYISPPRADKINFYQQHVSRKKFIPGVGTYEKAHEARDYQGPWAPEFARQKR
tara:strand:+ start:941 stop:1123 length:183 start_codon:yes stop_codon:yes gene_type:complete